jgi:hypothetical protein
LSSILKYVTKGLTELLDYFSTMGPFDTNIKIVGKC